LRPAALHIDLDAIRHNVRLIAQMTGPQVRQAAIVKANGYGHGAVPVSRACLQAGAAMLCVAIADEAVELREAGIEAPVLVLGPPDPDEAELYVHCGFMSTLSAVEHAAMLTEAAERLGGPAVEVHIKIDSGMGRHGARADVVEELAAFVAASPRLRVDGIFSHFGGACRPDLSWSKQQLATFNELLPRVLEHVGADRPALHIANSGAIVRMPDTRFDYVRPGAILYGLNPGFDDSLMPPLLPALSLRTKLATVKRLEKGAPVGYGATWQAPRETMLAVLPLGYADGYTRQLSNNADVLVGGRRCPLVGMVSMDAITVDVTDVPGAKVGDEAVLIGAQGGERITVEEISRRAGTIVEDTVGRLARRLPRIYHGEEADPA